jgi:glutamyl-Q tRNA(Asp) synthetase
MRVGFITRFAPSPTGLLHLGHAYSAWTAWDAAKAAGGAFIVRIEDLDQGRVRPAFEEAIFEDLAWLGLSWQTPVLRQSEHLARYENTLLALAARGLVYRCFKTRKELAAEAAGAPHRPGEQVFDGPAPDETARLATGDPFAWRLWAKAALAAVPQALTFVADGVVTPLDPALIDDAILGRKDFPASYHLASVLDDAAQGVTHIIRGEDLKPAAHLHRLLQALLNLPTPDYTHHRLILGPDGKRLAKRDAPQTLRALRETGHTPADLRAGLGFAPL